MSCKKITTKSKIEIRKTKTASHQSSFDFPISIFRFRVSVLERLERAQAGVRRRALQAVDDWQHRRQQEMARVTFDASSTKCLMSICRSLQIEA